MHALCLIDSVDASGGAEQALAAMAPLYVARGIRLDVGYLVERPGLQEQLREAGVGLVSLAGTGGRPGAVRRSYRLIRERRPDLVHTTLFEADIVGRIAAGAARVPVVSSLVNVPYGSEHLGDPSLSRRKVQAAQLVDAATARSVRRFHALTAYVAEVMAARLRIPRSRIDVIPRGRDPERLGDRSEERRRKVRASLGIADDVPLVLAAARHERQKGLDVLLRSFPFVSQKLPGAKLIVAGREGNHSLVLGGLIEELGLDDAVTFLGSRGDVPDLMCGADLFVLPSRWEGLGSTLLEAMALQVPIVASDLPPVREIVENDKTAVLVPPQDPSALGAALAGALHDRDGSVRRASLARVEFENRFTLDRVVEQMIAFYERAIGGSGRSMIS